MTFKYLSIWNYLNYLWDKFCFCGFAITYCPHNSTNPESTFHLSFTFVTLNKDICLVYWLERETSARRLFNFKTIFLDFRWVIHDVKDEKLPLPCLIGHVRYINIQTWFRGFLAKIVFLTFFCLAILKRDLDTKKTTPSLSWKPRSHVGILIYRTWRIIYTFTFLQFYIPT